MRKITLLSIITLVSGLALAGCSVIGSIQLPWSQPGSGQGQNPALDFASQPVENKLAAGLLKLEGSDLAVTADQAKQMLPLWRAVRGLGRGTAATNDEMTGLYQQIQELLSPAQVQAIQALSLTQEELQAMMEQYGVRFAPGGQGGAAPDPSIRATRQAQRASGSQGSGQGGPGFDGGMPGGGGPGGMPPMGMDPNSSGQRQAQGTPQPNQARPAGSGFRAGMNYLFLDPLLKLLEQRAGG